jgi:hypothetical protein
VHEVFFLESRRLGRVELPLLPAEGLESMKADANILLSIGLENISQFRVNNQAAAEFVRTV